MVNKSPCEECMSELRQKIVDDSFPEKYKDSEGFTKEEYSKEWEKHWESTRETLIEAEKEEENKFCFEFRADCGGDGVSICKKHLMEIIEKIDELTNNEL